MSEHGLILDLGGAPDTGLMVQGIGHFNPVTPTPLEDCNVSLEDAQKYDADPGCPLKLVKINTPTKTGRANTAEKE